MFSTFGVVRKLVCDKGTAFTIKEFKKHTSVVGIKVECNATAALRANGLK